MARQPRRPAATPKHLGESRATPAPDQRYPDPFPLRPRGNDGRPGADLLCLNSADDLALYGRGRKALGLDSSNAVVTGLPILWRTKQRTEAPENPSIVFFEQPSIPVHPLQRRFLCEQIKELAAAWPDHRDLQTTHIEHREHLHRRHGEMASVIDKMTRDQPNLRLSFKPATLLRQCGCAITVSSTAAMESMAMGISTRIVGDLGVTETLANHFFASSRHRQFRRHQGQPLRGHP